MLQFFGIITDCHCPNATLRQSLRVQSLFEILPSVTGVTSDLAAAGNLVDALDAVRHTKKPGVILVNVAPRHLVQPEWKNGTPFCYWTIGSTLIVSTLGGATLSLAKKVGVLECVRVFDIPTAVRWAAHSNLLTSEAAERAAGTQFRSFEFSPLVAKWITDGYSVPAENLALEAIPDPPPSIWHVDNFGNAKTTLLEDEWTETRYISLPYHRTLAKAPVGEVGWVTGSSGYGKKRWLELVINGASAAQRLNLSVGSCID